ncbi:hypothetical protein HFP57_08250 [Parasphingopyxis algicola]|uniref:hypothetical protein n=1 Tax=Parasphingopyxis algicola TaxID=2026624 RepID=UPI0015A43685|nr:hypothetical protein [Parasphingopyxis algicola]QLC25016.1 hypothetical protein HFP57_08250 [Parasphingopyxis algicola]
MQNHKLILPAVMAMAIGVTPALADSQESAEGQQVPPPTIDTNGDGTPDAWDRDGDGRPDAWDRDGDNMPDMVDDDGDGEPDEM